MTKLRLCSGEMSLKEGDQVTVEGVMAKDGTNNGINFQGAEFLQRENKLFDAAGKTTTFCAQGSMLGRGWPLSAPKPFISVSESCCQPLNASVRRPRPSRSLLVDFLGPFASVRVLIDLLAALLSMPIIGI